MASPTLLDNKMATQPNDKKRAFMKPDSKRAKNKFGPGKEKKKTRSTDEIRTKLYG